MADFDDFLSVLNDDEFEERPVDVRTFVEDEAFLGLTPPDDRESHLSDIQYTLVTAMTQIYNKKTLVKLYGEDEGEKLWKLTVNEVIAQLGKGSGKDYCSAIAVAYIVYKLLCLKEPAKYFGKSAGNAIDIINVAINAKQANQVFFKNLKTIIQNSEWFQGRYHDKMDSIEFDKNITCHSGHSEREGWEGYNTLVVILDEISGFAIENTTGHQQAKTADDIYKMYAASVSSRFEAVGKLILLSFPRFKGDFIQTRYESVIAEKQLIHKTHTFKLDPDLPDGTEGNEFTIEWDEDKIISYREPSVFALKLPTWEVNPTVTLEGKKRDFWRDPVDSLSRFACMPPEALDAFFKDRDKVERAFRDLNNPFLEDWSFRESFQPKEDKEYYVHVDLAYKHDRAAVALAHVENWVNVHIADGYEEPQPQVQIDAVRWWTPRTDQEIDFRSIRDYIKSLRQRGFNIKLVTFDRWQSVQTINELNEVGIDAERLSVAKPHYEDLALLIQEERVKGYYMEILIDELLKLRIIAGNKVDHPRKGSKDLADAVCGAAYNAVAHSKRDTGDKVIDVYLDAPVKEKAKEERRKAHEAGGVIVAPRLSIEEKARREEMPVDISEFLSRIVEI